MRFINNNGHVIKCPICGNDDLSCRHCNKGGLHFNLNFYDDNYYYDCSCGGVVITHKHLEEYGNSKPKHRQDILPVS